MAGTFRSAKREVLNHLRKAGASLVAETARSILVDSNQNVPQIARSRGYATDALKASGVVNVGGKGANDFEAAIERAMRNRQSRIESGKTREITRKLTPDDILPWAEPKQTRNQLVSNVQYPLRYAMLLEQGFTIEGDVHEQAFFLMGAVRENENDFFDAWRRLVIGLKGLSLANIDLEREMKWRRSQERYDAKQQRMVEDAARYGGVFHSWAEVVEWSGEKNERLRYGSHGRFREQWREARERILNAAIHNYERRNSL